MRYSCPIDGLEVDLADTLGTFSALLATLPVGAEADHQTDMGVVCPNGHHWAIRFKVEIGREA